jgi:hypothetical protein
MANRQDNNDSGPNPLLIFAILSGILVIVVMIVFVVIVIGGVTSTNKSPSSPDPYSVSTRPLPNVTNAGALLPKQLGKFQRGALTGTLDDYKATYKNGDYQIEISGSQAISVPLAKALVNTALKADSAAAIVQRQVNSDPSYYLTNSQGAIHYVWSHYRWFFDVKANSQAALDEFMKVFQY